MVESLTPAQFGGKGIDEPPIETTFDDGEGAEDDEIINRTNELRYGARRDIYLSGTGAKLILHELIYNPLESSIN